VPRPARALGDLKAKGMQINELTPAETARMRDKLTRVNASIAANVGMDLWNEPTTTCCRRTSPTRPTRR
jgi:TRAP-type C4-dicarboxylate transport system substrate-binding protein